MIRFDRSCMQAFAVAGGLSILGLVAGCPNTLPTPGDGSTPSVFCGTGLLGPTTHTESEITSDTTWTAAGSPHIVTKNINIHNGATLTIEPCVDVKLDPGVAMTIGVSSLSESGTLTAVGTPQEPIRFSANATERWENIRADYPGSAQLAFVTFEDGGSDEITYDGATLVIFGDSSTPLNKIVDVSHVTISGSAGFGAIVSRWGGFTDTSSDLTITGSGAKLTEFPYPAQVDAQVLGTLPTGKYVGNLTDEFLVNPRQGIVEDVTLRDLGVPYHVDGVGASTFLVEGDATVTMEAGVTVRFDPDLSFDFGTSISSGVLRAIGEDGNPVVFTSAAANPQPGDWVGIRFNAAPPAGVNNKLDYVRIEYAGGDCSCSRSCPSDVPDDAALLIMDWVPTAPFLTNSTISDSLVNGILRGWEDVTCGSDVLDFSLTNTFPNVAEAEQTTPKQATPECPTSCP